ncbi:hypothetical protein DSLASN_43130 [Desulfoluna limicola]|uniref:DUF4263 domain-containing protein n=1 Tax=Desulfoluna limicola TaxID=2810562 RepID=A0ABM7PN33_9BACT|nr:Shedu immune nuclease family protein [Desulfoluna limicola]BCS98681.1 hypothetical protein DSLASN_43130 [Desulfoluna limicola]
MEKLVLESTSIKTATSEPIELRVTDRIRLVFVPTIVNNDHDPNACVKGHFVYQKKLKAEQWEDIRDLKLTELRPSEGVKLELKSAELLQLLKTLGQLYRIHHRDGLPNGKIEYVKLSGALEGLCNSSNEDLKEFIELQSDNAVGMFKRIAKWLSNIEHSEKIVESLETLPPESLNQLNVVAGLSVLKQCLKTWESNRFSSDEEFWQKELTKNSFILSQVFSFPVVVVKDKAYVGGKSINNQGGNVVDFLYKNKFTNNAALIEIKTPSINLLGAKYRQTYNVSTELSGSVNQTLNYNSSLGQEYFSLVGYNTGMFSSFSPNCVVIIGNTQELNSPEKVKAFELYRNNLKNLKILTFDELFGRVENFIQILEQSN